MEKIEWTEREVRAFERVFKQQSEERQGHVDVWGKGQQGENRGAKDRLGLFREQQGG